MLLIRLVFCVVLLCVFTHRVSCCDVHYDFHIKTSFDSSLPLVVLFVGGLISYLFIIIIFVFACM